MNKDEYKYLWLHKLVNRLIVAVEFGLFFDNCVVFFDTLTRIVDATETDVFDDVPPSDDEEANQLSFDLSTDKLLPVYRLQPDSQKP